MKCIINDDVVLSQPLDGPLSTHILASAQWARDQRYGWAWETIGQYTWLSCCQYHTRVIATQAARNPIE